MYFFGENNVLVVDNRNAIINFKDRVVKLVVIFRLICDSFHIDVFIYVFIISFSFDKTKTLQVFLSNHGIVL